MPVSRQCLGGRHVCATTDTHATIEALLEAIRPETICGKPKPEAPFLKNVHVQEEKKVFVESSTRPEAKNDCAGEDRQQFNRPTG
jgi:hypothetical protein